MKGCIPWHMIRHLECSSSADRTMRRDYLLNYWAYWGAHQGWWWLSTCCTGLKQTLKGAAERFELGDATTDSVVNSSKGIPYLEGFNRMQRTSRSSGGWVRNLQDPVKRGIIESSVVDNKASGVRSWPPVYLYLYMLALWTGVVGQLLKILKRLIIIRDKLRVCGAGAKGKRSPNVILESAWTLRLKRPRALACDRKIKSGKSI